jgi:hypothetical protein
MEPPHPKKNPSKVNNNRQKMEIVLYGLLKKLCINSRFEATKHAKSYTAIIINPQKQLAAKYSNSPILSEFEKNRKLQTVANPGIMNTKNWNMLINSSYIALN